jgi:hypothetical protein
MAYGVGPIVGLFLVRFSTPPPSEIPDERERWVVVGDLPYMNFETEDAPTPDVALRLYCAICQDWADNVLACADLSDSYGGFGSAQRATTRRRGALRRGLRGSIGEGKIQPGCRLEWVVGRVGVEPTTIRLKVECSTAELPARSAGPV